MATFTKVEGKKSSSWEYRFVYKDPLTGKRKEKSKSGFKTKKEAQEAQKQFEQDLKDGFNEDNIPLKDYIFYWLDSKKKEEIRESTYENKLAQINKHILPYFQNIKLQDLEGKGMFYQEFIDQFAEKGYSRSTIENSHWILHAVFDLAVEEGKLKKNPSKNAKLKGKKKAKEDEYEFLATEDMQLLIEQAKKEGFVYYLFFKTLFETGLRKGEAAGLTWNDIDFETGMIDINKAMNTQKLKFTETKTAASVRKIRMKNLMPELRKLKKMQMEKRLLWGSEYDPEGMNLVFCREQGQPLPKSTLFNVFRRMQLKTGVIAGKKPEGEPIYFSIHATRHTHTAILIEKRIDTKVIQKRLGHSSHQVTMDIYAHVTNKLESDMTEVIDDIFENIF